MSAPLPHPSCLTPEQIRTVIDGTAEPSIAAHARSCDACAAGVGAMRADDELARDLVRARDRYAAAPIGRRVLRILREETEPSAGLSDSIEDAMRTGGEGRVLQPGERVLGYTIVRRLGAGGMGVVYLAEQDQPRRSVALKVVRADYATPGLLRRFEHEARALALLRHPGIAQVYQAGATTLDDADGRIHVPFIAMEYVPGERLDEAIKRHELSRKERLEVIANIADAVHHAHTRGVVHRDLKPANILAWMPTPGHEETAAEPSAIGTAHSRTGLQIRVLDFGVAKLLDDPTRSQTQATAPGGFVGTLAYAAPELVAGDPSAIDVRADVFSLGVMLYELLVGQRPLELGPSLASAIRAIAEAKVIPPASLGVVLDGELNTILLTALARDPGRRYPSAAALAEDIRRYLDKRPLRARPESLLYALRKAVERHPFRAATACAAVLAIAGVITVGVRLKLRADTATAAKGRVLDAVLAALERTNQDELNTPRVTSVTEFLADAGPVVDAQLSEYPEEHALLLSRLGRANLSHARLADAEEMLSRAANHYKASEKEQPAPYADALMDLGRVRQRKGAFKSAAETFEEARTLYIRAVGEDDTRTIAARYWLGAAKLGLRDHDQAERHLRAAVDAQRRIAPVSPEFAEYLNGLSACLRGRGDFESALAIAREALGVLEKSAGSDAKHGAVVLSNIAANLISLDRFAEAAPVLDRALELRRTWYGADDPRIANTLALLAGLRMRMGGFGETPIDRELLTTALEHAQHALRLRRTVHAGDHESIAEATSFIGQIRMRLGEYAPAIDALRQAAEMRSRLPRSHDGDLGRSESVLGECLYRAGELASAEAPLRSGLEKVRAAYGPTHRHTADATARLRSFLLASGREADAAALDAPRASMPDAGGSPAPRPTP